MKQEQLQKSQNSLKHVCFLTDYFFLDICICVFVELAINNALGCNLIILLSDALILL